MLLMVLTFLKTMFSGFWSVVCGIGKWCADHPALTVAILACACTFYGGTIYQERKDDKVIAVLKAGWAKIQNERAERIEALEKESTGLAAQLVTDKKSYEEATKDTVIGYEAKLAAERAKPTKTKVVTVEVIKPGTTVATPVDLTFEGDKLVCRQLPSMFLDSLNSLIDKVNVPAAVR